MIGKIPTGTVSSEHRFGREALEFLTQGYRKDLKSVLNGALFEAKSDEMVIVKDIDFYSLCGTPFAPVLWKVPHQLICPLTK